MVSFCWQKTFRFHEFGVFFLLFFANTTAINYFVNSMSLNRLFSIPFFETELFLTLNLQVVVVLLLVALFRNKRFMLDEMFQQNASKFAIFLEYENPCNFFISCYFIIFPNKCPGLCQHRHSLGGKNKVAWNEETKKKLLMWDMANFETLALEHFIKHKNLIFLKSGSSILVPNFIFQALAKS